ncbi:MAG: hypothetical protein JSS12_09330 [Verrucomicrobia bacterium]|nr:hypothetical protein [Verrucomicrobiota bacterium]
MSSIEALSLQAYSWGITTQFLNPSSYKLRKIQAEDSIFESTRRANIDLFAREKVEDSLWLSYGKPVRAVARALYTVAVSVLVAPVGICYHGISAGVRSVMMLQGQDAAQNNWKKVQDHARALFRELYVGFVGTIGLVYPITAYVDANPFAVVAGVFTNILPIANSIWPRFMAEFWHMPELKSHIMRDEFGIVAQNGALLPFNAAVDKEDRQFNGQLGKELSRKYEQMLQAVKAIQADKTNNLPFVYPPNGDAIASSIIGDVTLNLQGEKVPAKTYLTKLQSQINTLSELLKDCIEIHHVGKKRAITIACPIDQSAAEAYYQV